MYEAVDTECGGREDGEEDDDNDGNDVVLLDHRGEWPSAVNGQERWVDVEREDATIPGVTRLATSLECGAGGDLLDGDESLDGGMKRSGARSFNFPRLRSPRGVPRCDEDPAESRGCVAERNEEQVAKAE